VLAAVTYAALQNRSVLAASVLGSRTQ
jgi:hypothetical protein